MKKDRIIGLDLLRIFSMLGIVGLHVINNGGIINNLPITSYKHYIVLALLVLLYTSVDIFGILTGYLNINKKNNNNCRIVELILIVIFYCVLITTIFYGFNINSIRSLGYIEFIKNSIPPLGGGYWYITCYVFIFFMFPYLNRLLNSLNQCEYKRLLILLFIFLSIIPNIGGLIDFFHINNGYSPFWLLYMYMIGGYIKNYENDIKSNIKNIFLNFLGAFILNIIVRITSFAIFGHIILSDWFINYISPFIILLSVNILLIFKNIELKKDFIRKLVIFFSGTSFSVYIIHSHKLIYDYILKDAFIILTSQNALTLIGGIIISIVLIYVLCTVIDVIRKYSFKLLKIDNFVKFLGGKFDKILNG